MPDFDFLKPKKEKVLTAADFAMNKLREQVADDQESSPEPVPYIK